MLKKQQQNNNIKTKSPNVFNYLKSLSQEAKDLIDETEDAYRRWQASFYW